MTRRDFGAPFFPPPTFCLQFIWANAAIQRLHERKRKKRREGCLTVKWVSGRNAREREVKKYWNLFSFVACSWCYNSDKSPRREARLSCSFYRSHFHFFQTPPLPHRTAFSIFYVCSSFLFLYSFAACFLFFQFRQYFLVFFSCMDFFSFFTWSPGVALHVSCRRLAPLRGESSLSQHWLPSTRST